jgi:translation initiation factor 5A
MTTLSTLKPTGSFKVGDHILIRDRPCKITEISRGMTCKHGWTTVHFIGFDIFNNQKYDLIKTTNDNVDMPIITTYDYEVFDITDDLISCLDGKTDAIVDLNVLDLCYSDLDLVQKIQDMFYNKNGTEIMFVTIVSAMDISAIKGYKIV